HVMAAQAALLLRDQAARHGAEVRGQFHADHAAEAIAPGRVEHDPALAAAELDEDVGRLHVGLRQQPAQDPPRGSGVVEPSRVAEAEGVQRDPAVGLGVPTPEQQAAGGASQEVAVVHRARPRYWRPAPHALTDGLVPGTHLRPHFWTTETHLSG